jgi:DNA-binding MarR family transcriptional regulator
MIACRTHPSYLDPQMGTHGQDDLSRIGEAFDQVFRASHAARLHERALARAGANVDRTGFLLLSRLGVEDSVRVSDLAVEMGLDASTISRKVQDLEAAGLVARAGHPADRRAAVLSLTREGRTVSGRIKRERARLLEGILADWPEPERARLAELLEQLATDIRGR